METKSLGKELKAYRVKNGWSQQVCAEKIGISTRYLADIERGYKLPKLETFVAMLNTLEASADDVLQDSLTIGYTAKSNAALSKLERLDAQRQKQALSIFSYIISTFEAEEEKGK